MLLSLTPSTKPQQTVQKTAPQLSSQISSSIPNVLNDSITLKRPPRFGNRLLLNHGIKFPDIKLAYEQAGQAQYAMILKSIDMAAKSDKSHLLFSINLGKRDLMAPGPGPLKGLADAIPMFSHPVDTLVENHATVDGLRLLQSATGKRYMDQYAHISLSPPDSMFLGHTKDARVYLRIFNEAQRDLEWLVMNRTGKQDRQAVFNELHSKKTLNSLSSLAYGEKGLVDAVIVGHDQLLTRSGLEKYYTAHGLTGEDKRERFNQQASRLAAVVQWLKQEKLLESFNRFAPNSISEKPKALQKSVLDKKENIKKAGIQTRFHSHNDKFDPKGEEDLDRFISISPIGKTTITEIQHVPASLQTNTFIRDCILFPAHFNSETGEQVLSFLDKIYEKTAALSKQSKPVSNALIVANTPGGDSDVTNAIRSKVESALIPTDIIIQGWGASGGARLVCMATGNRFITPSSSILLHETKKSPTKNYLDKLNHAFKKLEIYSRESQHLIAEKTGRPYNEVCKDFKLDFEVNPIESILYGSKGLVDAILVGPDKILTRDAVMNFVIDKKGSTEAAQRYIDDKFIQRREGNYTAHLDEHKLIDEDPLANPLQLIHELVQQGKAVPLNSIERFKASLSDVAGRADRSMHLYKVAEKPQISAKK